MIMFDDDDEYLVKQIQEFLDDEETGFECSKCGNKTEWILATNTVNVTLDSRGKKVVGVNYEKRITKPDDFTFICGKCKIIEFQGVW